jgi:hypothetical protein
MKIEVYTTKRQGIKKYLTTTIIFKRTTKEGLKRAVTQKIGDHGYKILNKEDAAEWMRSRT